MDPFSAVGLAGSILQFIDFGCKVVSRSSEIIASATGEPEAHSVLRTITTDLEKFSANLTSATLPPSAPKAEGDIKLLADHYRRESNNLIEILNKLRLPDRGGRLPSVYLAMKSLSKKKEINDIRERLGDLKSQLMLHILALISDQNSGISQLIWSLTEASSGVSLSTSNQLKVIQAAIYELRQSTEDARRCPEPNSGELAAISSNIESMVKVGEPIARERAVLRSLQFDSMRMRESNVVDAHAHTFEWTFSDDFKLNRWLSTSKKGIFWVSGKPGSGKSTLMKFISRHKKTITALQSWTEGQSLVTTSFFFWIAGNRMQKSLHGLLQSLLFEVMRQCRPLIPIVSPARWKNAFDLSLENGWTWHELKVAFERLVQQSSVSVKTCIFIDGLDEYDGDHNDMIELLSSVANSPNFKLCLASRPWNVFNEAYGRSPDLMLRLQDLTRDDIHRYTSEKLEAHSGFQQLKTADCQYEHLIEEIVNKSDGVFLWVMLVVRSLKEGITNADTVSTLQKRLRQLPSDLERFFQHILDGVDRVYLKGTAQVFQMASTAVHPLPLWVYSVLDEVDTNFVLDKGISCIGNEEYEQKTAILEKRLNARCKGLLEVQRHDHSDPHRVDFLHRTVRDFLKVKEVDTMLISRLQSPFDVDLTLCRGFLLELKQLHAHPSSIFEHNALVETLRDFVYHAHRMEEKTASSPIQLLSEFRRAISHTVLVEMFYTCIIQQGLLLYLEHQLGADPRMLRHQLGGKPLLADALMPTASQNYSDRYDYTLNPNVVGLLLDHGANPNQSYKSYKSITAGRVRQTVWEVFLLSLLSTKEDVDCEATFQVVRRMIRGRARQDVVVTDNGNRMWSLAEVIELKFSPPKAKLLIQLMEEVRQGGDGTNPRRYEPTPCSQRPTGYHTIAASPAEKDTQSIPAKDSTSCRATRSANSAEKASRSRRLSLICSCFK